MSDCFFCKCLDEKNYELENEYAIARYDDFPVNKGHLEVITKRHIKDWWDTTPEEKLAIFELLIVGYGNNLLPIRIYLHLTSIVII